MPYFPHPKTIYIVSWCDRSSVGGLSRRLSMPGAGRERRRLHQIFGRGKQPRAGRGRRKIWVWLMVQSRGWEEREALQQEDGENRGEGNVSRRDVKEDQAWGKTVRVLSKAAILRFILWSKLVSLTLEHSLNHLFNLSDWEGARGKGLKKKHQHLKFNLFRVGS